MRFSVFLRIYVLPCLLLLVQKGFKITSRKVQTRDLQWLFIIQHVYHFRYRCQWYCYYYSREQYSIYYSARYTHIGERFHNLPFLFANLNVYFDRIQWNKIYANNINEYWLPLLSFRKRILRIFLLVICHRIRIFLWINCFRNSLRNSWKNATLLLHSYRNCLHKQCYPLLPKPVIILDVCKIILELF